MSYRLTILGSGSSTGVPRVGGDWGNCDPKNPKNRRRRSAALIERRSGGKTTTVLIDTGPDLREQLIAAGTRHIDGVLYTHDHADHTHGIDDLRMIAYAMKKKIPIWADDITRASLLTRFGYCFVTPAGRNYPPILRAHPAVGGEMIVIEGEGGPIEIMPVLQDHGEIPSFGFRSGGVLYSPDISNMPAASLPLVENLDVWIIDALRFIPHPSHLTVGQALEWISRVKPKRGILTHLHIDVDYEKLRRELPDHVVPAYDGMVVEFSA
jgi:phosphoribosyl 1,2-cyclic phosphate phosphodiesterase